MSNAKFTKGKWFACCGSYEVAVLNNEKFIETLITDTGPSTIPCDDEAQANQNLIAAAPDMYKALDRVRQGYLNLCELNIIPDRYQKDAYIIIDQINDLLSKARGEI